jgi:hypothetical protein
VPNAIEQGIVWDFYKPRHTHAWNMLQLAAQHLAKTVDAVDFETEYAWENLIIRLSLYRNAVKTLTKLPAVALEAEQALGRFDAAFFQNGKNALIALRNMFEHFDDYAAGMGRGPAERNTDLDPWRFIDVQECSRGQFKICLTPSMEAANNLRTDAKAISDKFICWYKEQSACQFTRYA